LEKNTGERGGYRLGREGKGAPFSLIQALAKGALAPRKSKHRGEGNFF